MKKIGMAKIQEPFNS